MIDDKVKELLEAKQAFVDWANYQDAPPYVKRLMKAISAFEPPKPKRGELWANEYGQSYTTYRRKELAIQNNFGTAVRTAVHYREVLPGDENIVLVKPGKDWTDDELNQLRVKYTQYDGDCVQSFRAVIDAIHEKCKVM